MRASFIQPAIGLGIAYKIEQLAQQAETIPPAKPEACRVGSKGTGECPGVVENVSKRIGDDLRNCAGLLAIGEEVRCDPRRPRHEEAVEIDPLVVAELA